MASYQQPETYGISTQQECEEQEKAKEMEAETRSNIIWSVKV